MTANSLSQPLKTIIKFTITRQKLTTQKNAGKGKGKRGLV